MVQYKPMVSIGIPTYNRSVLLKRSIESALKQDYENLEVIVSDNASTDHTKELCQIYCDKDPRFKFIHHQTNLGPSKNFAEVLINASGNFFMWLGDDDWIDECYVSTCVAHLISDDTMSLVSGMPQYYRNGHKSFTGKSFNLLYASWWRRVLAYYAQVADNGMFYGMMRTAQIREVEMPRIMGSDWLMLAQIVSIGKARMVSDVSVHRELGGATVSYQKIANSLGLPKVQAIFPTATIALYAWLDITIKGKAFKSRPVMVRLLVGTVAISVIFVNQSAKYLHAIIRRTKSKINQLLYKKLQ